MHEYIKTMVALIHYCNAVTVVWCLSIHPYYISAPIQAFPSGDEMDNTGVGWRCDGKENRYISPKPQKVPANHKQVNGGSEAPDPQNITNMKETRRCKKCGQIFQWNQLQWKWQHECTAAGSAESSKCLEETVGMPKASARPTKIGQNAKVNAVDMTTAATDNLPKCGRCGQTFGWHQLHLRWKHKCEPTEVVHTSGYPHQRKRSLSASSDVRLRMPLNIPMAGREGLHFGTTEHDAQSETDSTPQVCQCGKTFAAPGIQFVKHELSCPDSATICPGRHSQSFRNKKL